MKKIEIRIYGKEDGKLTNNMVEVESEDYNFIYVDIHGTHHNMQCNYDGDTYEYDNLLNKLMTIVKTVKSIDKEFLINR